MLPMSFELEAHLNQGPVFIRRITDYMKYYSWQHRRDARSRES